MKSTLPREHSSNAIAQRPNQREVDSRDQETERRERRAPFVDVVEFDDAYVVTAEMPGVCDDGVEVDFQDGELTIIGRVAERRRRDDATQRAFGFEPKDYFRSFRVGDSIDSDQIAADFCDGLLALRLPKRKEIQPRKIAVNAKPQSENDLTK